MPYKAIVIGATSGIGLETARLLWKEGAVVGVAGRRTDRLRAFCDECGARAKYRTIDITDNNAGHELSMLINEIGGADLILFCSGIGSQNPDLVADTELKTVEPNAVGFTRIIDEAFNYFKQKGSGHIAAITSIAGTKGLGIAASYSATKRYQNTYMQCLAQLSHMQGHNIRFTDIRPGFVDTDLLAGSGCYPMLMDKTAVARKLLRAVGFRRHVSVIDWRYRFLVFFWRLIPNWLWRRLKITNK